MVLPAFPADVRDALGQITSLAYPARQGLTSQVIFVEATPGAIVVKRSTGRHNDPPRHEHVVVDALSTCGLLVLTPVLFVEHPGDERSVDWLLRKWLPDDG